MQLSREIACQVKAEVRLAGALRFVAMRHASDAEIRDLARILASWSDANAARLRELASSSGRTACRDVERLAGRLLRGLRLGGPGLLRDLEDLAALAARVKIGWVALGQAAKAKRDELLERLCADASGTTRRQVAWIETHVKHVAPQALLVQADPLATLRASLPPLRPALVAGAPLLGLLALTAARSPVRALGIGLLGGLVVGARFSAVSLHARRRRAG